MRTGQREPAATPQDRIGTSTRRALRHAFQPDAFQPDVAGDDVLDGLIEQLRRLPWPRGDGAERHTNQPLGEEGTGDARH